MLVTSHNEKKDNEAKPTGFRAAVGEMEPKQGPGIVRVEVHRLGKVLARRFNTALRIHDLRPRMGAVNKTRRATRPLDNLTDFGQHEMVGVVVRVGENELLKAERGVGKPAPRTRCKQSGSPGRTEDDKGQKRSHVLAKVLLRQRQPRLRVHHVAALAARPPAHFSGEPSHPPGNPAGSFTLRTFAGASGWRGAPRCVCRPPRPWPGAWRPAASAPSCWRAPPPRRGRTRPPPPPSYAGTAKKVRHERRTGKT